MMVVRARATTTYINHMLVHYVITVSAGKFVQQRPTGMRY
jgi:hypothetical protein